MGPFRQQAAHRAVLFETGLAMTDRAIFAFWGLENPKGRKNALFMITSAYHVFHLQFNGL